jgi:hypothetical protein
MKAIAIFAAAGLCAVAPAMPAWGAAKAKPKYDPDRIICVNRGVLGSRLQRIRVCHTAQEWEEVRVQERVGLMRKQTNGSAGGGPVPVRDSAW